MKSTQHMKSVGIGPDANAIVIERREVVAVVAPDDGDQPMLTAAFIAAAKYIGENATMTAPISLEWRYGGSTFRAGYAPVEPDTVPVNVDDDRR